MLPKVQPAAHRRFVWFGSFHAARCIGSVGRSLAYRDRRFLFVTLGPAAGSRRDRAWTAVVSTPYCKVYGWRDLITF